MVNDKEGEGDRLGKVIPLVPRVPKIKRSPRWDYGEQGNAIPLTKEDINHDLENRITALDKKKRLSNDPYMVKYIRMMIQYLRSQRVK